MKMVSRDELQEIVEKIVDGRLEPGPLSSGDGLRGL